MRLAEGSRNPDRTGIPGGVACGYGGPSGAALLVRECIRCSCAWRVSYPGAEAQNAVGVIEQRIESTFDLVIGNSAELAIPLTRRALARRSEEDKNGVDAARLQATTTAETDPRSARRLRRSGVRPLSIRLSADAADMEVARLPRPRPDAARATRRAGPRRRAPLDLVAGAAAAAA